MRLKAEPEGRAGDDHAEAFGNALGPSTSHVLEVARDGAWFRVRDTGTVEIPRRHLLRSLLLALASSSLDDPDRSLTTEQLVQALWPGDRTPHRSARNRLYFAMNALREIGLRDVVVRSAGGYAIAKHVVVRLS